MGTAPSYAHGASPVPLLGETIGARLDATIARYGEREALVSRHQDLRYTWAELGEAVDRVARGLIALGLEPGDRLGIWSPNCAEWVLVQFATARLGVVLVNINPAYRTTRARVRAAPVGLPGAGGRAGVQDLGLRRDGRRGARRAPRARARRVPRRAATGTSCWPAATASTPARSPRARPRRSSTTPINIQYTSGTTGFPKGATLTHHNILNNGYFVGRGCRYTESDRVCIPVPFYHCFGMVMGNLACAAHGAAW